MNIICQFAHAAQGDRAAAEGTVGKVKTVELTLTREILYQKNQL